MSRDVDHSCVIGRTPRLLFHSPHPSPFLVLLLTKFALVDGFASSFLSPPLGCFADSALTLLSSHVQPLFLADFVFCRKISKKHIRPLVAVLAHGVRKNGQLFGFRGFLAVSADSA